MDVDEAGPSTSTTNSVIPREVSKSDLRKKNLPW